MKKPMIVLMSLLAGACATEEPGAVPRPETPAAVTVSESHQTGSLRTFPGTVVAQNEAQLATRMAGTILNLPVDVGSVVRAGDTLAVLDGQDVRARIAGARANVELAAKSFQRIQNLARDGAASQHELDQATAALTAAEAGLADARAQGDYTVLLAPFAGTVTRRMADPGDLAAPGQPILTVAGLGALEVEADLPADLAGTVRTGDQLALVVPSTGVVTSVVVRRVSPALERGSRRFRVEAGFDAPVPEMLVSGSYVRLGIADRESAVQWVPMDALVTRGQLTGLFVVSHDEVRLRWVRVGEQRGDGVELLAGPEAGSWIVRRPSADLFDGRPVSGVTPEEWAIPAGTGEVIQ